MMCQLLCALVLLTAFSLTAFAQADGELYKLPNPFDLDESKQQAVTKQFYMIRSKQTTGPPENVLEVEDYFSLDMGLSYSIHKRVDDPKVSWAVISDGGKGKSYIVRNIDSSPENELECELDHAHTGRQTFPWQFAYDTKHIGLMVDPPNGNSTFHHQDMTSGDRTGKRGKKTRAQRALIYGVGAIWLNAILRDVRSDQVGDLSPYPDENTWSMIKNGVEIELRFKKNMKSKEKNPIVSDDDAPSQIRIQREHPVLHGGSDHTQANDNIKGATKVKQRDYDIIEVIHFRTGLQKETNLILKRFFKILDFCRETTKQQRLFPSILRALSSSPDRAVMIHYLADIKSPSTEGSGNTKAYKYDPMSKRYLVPVTLRFEAFSLTKESHMAFYLPLEFDFSEPHQDRLDVFWRRFTEKVPQSTTRQVSHPTGYYHAIKSLFSKFFECKVNEAEDNYQEPIFRRSVYFSKGPEDVQIHGHMSGLISLLMNAAEAHHKQFDMMTKKIRGRFELDHWDQTIELSVDEWKLVDDDTNWSVHFYFNRPHPYGKGDDKDSFQGRWLNWWEKADAIRRSALELSELKRIEVRDISLTNERLASAQNVPPDHDLLMQFDIFYLKFVIDDHWKQEYMFEQPKECSSEQIPANGDADQNEMDESCHVYDQ